MPFPTEDPEAVHESVRFRGSLSALSEIYRDSQEGGAGERIELLLRAGEQRIDAMPSAGWDTTTAALRLLSILEANETIASAGLRWPISPEWMNRFVKRHEMSLAIGTVVEPSGNHRLINIAGRAASHTLLHPTWPLPEKLGRDVIEIVRSQWLADGGHIELSPHYHLQVLAILALICRVDDQNGGRLLPALELELRQPLAALSAMISASSEPLRFGDIGRTFSGRNPEVDVRRVLNTFARPSAAEALPNFGLHRRNWATKHARIELVADCGPVGHANNAGHGHADGLSFCLFADGKEVLTDPGTFLYANDAAAMWFKLPAAHNTVNWPRTPSHLLSSFFRWSRTPPAPSLHRQDDCSPQLRLGATQRWRIGRCRYGHSRAWHPNQHGVTVFDWMASSTGEHAELRMNLPPESTIVRVKEHEVWLRVRGRLVRISIASGSDASLALTDGAFAPRYGVRMHAFALISRIPETRPWTCVATRIEVRN